MPKEQSDYKRLSALGFIIFLAAYPILYIATITSNLITIIVGAILVVIGLIMFIFYGILLYLNRRKDNS